MWNTWGGHGTQPGYSMKDDSSLSLTADKWRIRKTLLVNN
jgi:hypothetical protein